MTAALPTFVTDSPAAARIRDRGGIAHVLALFEQHAGPRDVAKALGIPTAAFTRWLLGQPADVQDRLREIQHGRAAALAEETVALADATLRDVEQAEDAKPADRIKATNAAISARQWMAERLDRERWSPKTADTTVTVTVASLHLDALRRRFATVQAGSPPDQGPDSPPVVIVAQTGDQPAPALDALL